MDDLNRHKPFDIEAFLSISFMFFKAQMNSFKYYFNLENIFSKTKLIAYVIEWWILDIFVTFSTVILLIWQQKDLSYYIHPQMVNGQYTVRAPFNLSW